MVGEVRIRLFATTREAVGVGEVRWEVPPEGIALPELLDALGHRYRPLGPLLGGCRIFVNGVLVPRRGRRRLHGGDELSLHPPYSGG